MKFLTAAATLLCALFSTVAFAQTQTGPAPSIAKPVAPMAAPPQSGSHALTAADLDAYFDGFIPLAIGRGDIAGAEVAVVKGGQVLFEKGYGVSDTKAWTHVDPKTTLFRPGSISKLFTWTSVMQLVEQHKIDLDADVNTYLDFTVPHTWGKPVTMRDLMTHTPGFEETIKNLLAVDPKAMPTLAAGIKAWVPDQIFPPGTTPAYSNYGAGLAGYIVQRVSGEPFAQYVQDHIFTPLGMTHSTFVQPLPKAMQKNMSKGYVTASGTAKPFELIWMAPAGGLSTTAGDMTKFMRAYLDGGELNGQRILKPETIKLMWSEIYQRNPPLAGIGLGFYHEDANGHVIVGHGGDTVVFHSDLHFIPDAGVAFYYSQNSAGKPNSGVRGPLFEGFLNRYFPAPKQKPQPALKSAKKDGAVVAGNYDTSRRSESSFMRIASGQLKVSLNGDGTLGVSAFTGLNGEPRKWREVAPFVWHEVHGPHLLIAKVKDGKAVEIESNELPQIITFQRGTFWNSSSWNMPLMIAALAMLALTVVFWPLKAILRWRYQRPFPLTGRARALYRATRIVALIDLVFVGGYLAALTYGGTHLEFFSSSDAWVILLLQIVGVIGVIGVIVPLWELWVAVGDHRRPWWTKGTDTLIALACLSVVWFAFSLNLVNFHLNY